MVDLKVKSDCISRTSNLKHLGVAYRTMALGIGRPKFLIKKKNSIWRSDFLCFPPLINFCIFAIFTTKKKSAQKLVWQHLAKNLIRFFAKLLWATKKSTPLFYEQWLSTIDESPNRRKALFTDTWSNFPIFSVTLRHSHWKHFIFLSFFYLNEKSRNTFIEE